MSSQQEFHGFFVSRVTGIVAVALLLNLGACGGSSGNRQPVNSPPSANAGADQIIDEQSIVQLAGQGSDPDGGIVSFAWSQISGPNVALSSNSDPDATFVAPQVAIGDAMDVVLSLRVTDSLGASRSDEVTVSVQPSDTLLFRAMSPGTAGFELFAFDTGSAEARKISGALVAGGSVMEMSTSPDGRYVAYRADQDSVGDTELYVAAIDGSDVTKVSGTLVADGDVSFKEFAWSPDSSQIVFIAQGDEVDVEDVYLVDRDGSNLRQINTNFMGDLEYSDVSWSPDGRYVAARATNYITSRVIGIATHDSTATSTDGIQVTPVLPASADIKSYRWSYDGQFIAYRADIESDENFQVYTVRPDGSDHTLVARGVSLTAPNAGVAFYEWSPIDHSIAFAAIRIDGALRLYVVQADGTDEVEITPDIDSGESLISMSWSPNGSRLAYIADQDTADVYELYSVEPDGTGNLNLSGMLLTDGDVRGPAQWSPDSAWLVYRAVFAAGGAELHAASADASLTVVVDQIAGSATTIGTGLQLWSPDGNKMMYASILAGRNNFDLLVWDVISQASTRVNQIPVSGDGLLDLGVWSDDSSRIAYVFSQNSMQAGMYLASPDGLVNEQIMDPLLIDSTVSELFFIWFPEGRLRPDERSIFPP